jgi:hypothetical protein
VADVWTQTLNLRWRPSLRFYEQRIAILRDFDERGVLRAFAVEDGPIGAQVLTAGHQLTVRHDGLTISVVGPNADVGEIVALAQIAVAHLKLSKMRVGQSRFQHIEPLELEFEQAVSAAVGSILRFSAAPGLECSDWSVLADFRSTDQTAGQMEFGLIRDHEAAARIEGRIGRLGSSGFARAELPRSTYPPVALFADSTWEKSQQDDDSFEAIQEYWTVVKDRAAVLVDGLHQQIRDESTRLGYLGGDNE